ncbi:MAG TPA: hypothetical protein VEB20_18540 [Azospirillaceae bacterium]|nr:hypothetical protein [Azospirillaceae bacterium]
MHSIDALSPPRGRAARRLPPLLKAAALLAALSAALAGCADIPLPEVVFADGPAPAEGGQANTDPMAVLTGQRPVRRIDETNAEYPHLGTVPPRPTNLPDPMSRQQQLDALAADRRQAEEQAGALRAVPAARPAADPGSAPAPQVPDAPPPAPSGG